MFSRAYRFLFVLPLCVLLIAVGNAYADPPGRVGRLALVQGVVMLHNPALDRWEDASVNWPVTSHDWVYTGTDGRAEIRVGSTVLRLDHDTELRVAHLDDERFHVWLEFGRVAVRLRSDDPSDRVMLETRDGHVLVNEPGRYRIEYADAATTVTADSGRVTFVAPDRQMEVHRGQSVVIWFDGGTQFSSDTPLHDDFSAWVLARDRQDDARGTPRYVSPEMTGAEDLAIHGDWHQAANYGPVWYPRHVSSGWAPYRDGRWAWVDPWGWTWVDHAPWGFAPFHYGRWAFIGSRWAWVPGAYVVRPVYAPALVAWVGSSGWSVGFSIGHRPALGWFPLGPHDVFVPTFRASPVFVRKVNITHVKNVTRITQVSKDPRKARYTHRHHPDALTVVSKDTVVRGRPVRSEAARDAQRWSRDIPVTTALPAYERHGPALQEHGHAWRFAEQRQRRADEDRVVRTERLRSGAFGSAPPARRSTTATIVDVPQRAASRPDDEVQRGQTRSRTGRGNAEVTPLREAGSAPLRPLRPEAIRPRTGDAVTQRRRDVSNPDAAASTSRAASPSTVPNRREREGVTSRAVQPSAPNWREREGVTTRSDAPRAVPDRRGPAGMSPSTRTTRPVPGLRARDSAAAGLDTPARQHNRAVGQQPWRAQRDAMRQPAVRTEPTVRSGPPAVVQPTQRTRSVPAVPDAAPRTRSSPALPQATQPMRPPAMTQRTNPVQRTVQPEQASTQREMRRGGRAGTPTPETRSSRSARDAQAGRSRDGWSADATRGSQSWAEGMRSRAP